MGSTIDLHMHSEFSDDGTFAPEELAEMCIRQGLKAFALSDHNNTRGVARAIDRSRGSGTAVLPAVELECRLDGKVLHVLGYGIDHTDRVYGDIWEDVLEKERAASKERMGKVRALGIGFESARVEALAKWGIVTGEMLAEAAMEYDVSRENPMLRPYYQGGSRGENALVNFYWDFFGQGGYAFVDIAFMPLAQAARVITQTGGIPVLAHPGHNTHEDRTLLDTVFAHGVKGIEAFSSYHSAEQTAFYTGYAAEHGLLATCGSDFHGKVKPAIRIGSVDCGGKEREILEGLGVRAP